MNIYQSDYRQTPLIFELIKNHDNEAAKLHLETHPEEINLKGWMDDTPLHIASLSNNIELVRYLVEQGAEVNARRSSVYVTPLCWSENIEISRFLLDHGATVKDDELYFATRVDKPEIVDLLLSSGAILNPKEPQYLAAKSIECLQVYLDHGISLNKMDTTGKILLHQLIWMDLPEVFDFAYKNGAPWGKNAEMHLLYHDAKVRGKKKMAHHIETQYPDLITYHSVPGDPQKYELKKVRFLQQIPGQEGVFIAISDGTHLLRYSVNKGIMTVEQVSTISTLTPSNFTFDKSGNIVLPTRNNQLLIMDTVSFEIIRIVSLPENLLLGQLTWLPRRNCFVAGHNWDIVFLDEDFKLIQQIQAEDGAFLPKIHPDERFLAFHSYDQVEYFNLYRLSDELEITFTETFFKDWENSSSGFAFNGNEFAVSFPKTLEYYRLPNNEPEKLWEIDISGYSSKHGLSSLVCIDPNTLILAKGKVLLFVDVQQQQIIRDEILDLECEIREIYLDSAKKHLFISTDSELKSVPLH